MRKIATIIKQDRMALFNNASINAGMNAAVIEKDFWVCWMLDYLLSVNPQAGVKS